MSRPLRIEYPGAWYHVMNRGAGRKKIFRDNEQKNYFLSLLSDTHQRFQAEWHAYCLMDNHYHLLLRTPEGNLQRIMRHINGLYTQYFNRRQRTDGPLFRGRYKAILVDAEAYWLQLSRYIHRNPLEAAMTKRLEHYPWSSYPAYIGRIRPPDWLTTHYILNAIGKRSRPIRYQAYVTEDTDDALQNFYRQAKQSPVLGNEAFRSAVLAGKPALIDIPELNAAKPRPDLETILAAITRYYDTTEDQIWQSQRGKAVTSPARSVAMYLCQHAGAMRLREIANIFGLASYASASSVIRTVKYRLENDQEFAKGVDSILLDLTPSPYC
ncbi:MAG TPA: hypothetical protein ENI98_05080 [Gammaproteobacteria bacterium]|nr:hypothetical protein [Gammaproteobacteria bacterium]